MDFVLTVCDSAAGETCLGLAGDPVTAHGDSRSRRFHGAADEKRAKFESVYARSRPGPAARQPPAAQSRRMATEKKVRHIGAPTRDLGKRLTSEGNRNRTPARDDHRVRDHGRAAAAGKRPSRFRERDRHRSRLVARIFTVRPDIGAHSIRCILFGSCLVAPSMRDVPLVRAVQVIGAFAGAPPLTSFGEPCFGIAKRPRRLPLIWSEVVATVGLICVIAGTVSARPSTVPWPSADISPPRIGSQLPLLSQIGRYARESGTILLPALTLMMCRLPRRAGGWCVSGHRADALAHSTIAVSGKPGG